MRDGTKLENKKESWPNWLEFRHVSPWQICVIKNDKDCVFGLYMINEGNWERHYFMLTTLLRGRLMVFFFGQTFIAPAL
jgi:hypothetical protein